MCNGLIADNAKLSIYDPKVSETQINQDLNTPKFEWDHPGRHAAPPRSDAITVCTDPYEVFGFPAKQLIPLGRLRLPANGTMQQSPQAACHCNYSIRTFRSDNSVTSSSPDLAILEVMLMATDTQQVLPSLTLFRLGPANK